MRLFGIPLLSFAHPFNCRGYGCNQGYEHDRQRQVSSVRAAKNIFRGKVKTYKQRRRQRGDEQMLDEFFLWLDLTILL